MDKHRQTTLIGNKLVFVLNYLGFVIRVFGMSNNQPNAGPKRAGYSIAEVSSMFGKHRSWGYRQVWLGRIKVSMGFGEAIVSDDEVARIKGAGLR